MASGRANQVAQTMLAQGEPERGSPIRHIAKALTVELQKVLFTPPIVR